MCASSSYDWNSVCLSMYDVDLHPWLGVDEMSGDAMVAVLAVHVAVEWWWPRMFKPFLSYLCVMQRKYCFLFPIAPKYSHILSLFESLSLTLRKPLSPHPDLLNCEHGDFWIIMSIIIYCPEKLESSGRMWLLEFSGTAQMRRITLVSSLHP